MRDIRITAAQFEARSGEKTENLARMRTLAAKAAARGAEFVAFHELCVTGSGWLHTLDRESLEAIAEPVPGGPSTEALVALAGELEIGLLAGLVEIEDSHLFNTYVVATGDGIVAKHRILAPEQSALLECGPGFTVFDLYGCRCGIVPASEAVVVEHMRTAVLRGAEIVFMPHAGTSLPGTVLPTIDPAHWHNRDPDPVPLRREFAGLSGRGGLMRWVPTRAYENGVYVVFAHAVGLDTGQVRCGNAMVLDPCGEVLAECNRLGAGIATALCTADGYRNAPGRRFIRARRPELYALLAEPAAPSVASGGPLRRAEAAPS